MEAMLAGTRGQLGPHNLLPTQLYPLGYPESLIGHLGYFFLEMTPEDIHKWNVTSPQIVKSLLRISKGREMDEQVRWCPLGTWPVSPGHLIGTL